MTELIPAIDIIQGRCVRLSKGDYSTGKVYGDPIDMASAFADAGASSIHLVDLDGAKASEPCNLKILEKIANRDALQIEWGGGLKSAASIDSCFSAGASWAIIGSVAALEPELFMEWLEKYGADKIVFGADVRNGKLAVKGWLEEAGESLDNLLTKFCANSLDRVICTDISKDGMLCGPDLELYKKIASDFPNLNLTVSGGISGMDDIRAVNDAGLKSVIVGKAFYEGRITLQDMKSWWQKG